MRQRWRICYHHSKHVPCVVHNQACLEIFRNLYAKDAPDRDRSAAGGSRTICPARQAGEGLSIQFESDQPGSERAPGMVFAFSDLSLCRRTTHVLEPCIFLGPEVFGCKERFTYRRSGSIETGTFPGLCL